MSRNIIIAQKRAPDFHKSDALAQTNQSMAAIFYMTEKIHKKRFLKI